MTGPWTLSVRRREVVVDMAKLCVGALQETHMMGEHGRILISDGPVLPGQPAQIVPSPPAWISSTSWAPLQLPIAHVLQLFFFC